MNLVKLEYVTGNHIIYNVIDFIDLLKNIIKQNKGILFALVDDNIIVYHSLNIRNCFDDTVSKKLNNRYTFVKINYNYELIMNISNFNNYDTTHNIHDSVKCNILFNNILELIKDKNYIEDKKLICFIFYHIKNYNNNNLRQLVTSFLNKVEKLISDDLKKDMEFCLIVAKNHNCDFMFIKNLMKINKVLMIELIKNNTYSLVNVSNEWGGDKDVVLTAVKNNGHNLKFASDDLRNDRDIVLAAIKTNGCCLMYASDELRNNKKMVLKSVCENFISLQYASNELRNDIEVITFAASKNINSLRYASEKLINNKEFMLNMVNQNEIALKYVPDDLRNDIKVISKPLPSIS